MTSLQEHRLRMRSDIGIIAASVFFAVYLVASGILEQTFSAFGDLFLLGAFFAGIFFTSVFTVFPAMAVLGELATQAPLFPIALAGATGAAIGDFVIFKFLRDHILGDFSYLISQARKRRWKYIFHLRIFRFFVPFIGALVIASPLPDEIGITMLGIARTRSAIFIPLSFAMNFLGIVVVGLAARGMGI